MEEIIMEINTEYITLTQFLKGLGLIGTGGQAKAYLASEEVYVDGELERRRGRKLYSHSLVELPSENAVFLIKAAGPDSSAES